jgi:putative DNA primase/helicase
VLSALDAAGWIYERGSGGEKAKKTAIGPRRLGLYWILPGDLE